MSELKSNEGYIDHCSPPVTECALFSATGLMPLFSNFIGLVTAAALGQVSESATTWQIFRQIEYAAGMPQDILPATREQTEQSDPQALQWVSTQRALRLASSIGGLAYGGANRLIFGRLSHEQIGRTRAYVITKWRQSEIQQAKETKAPPPRTHGKVGDPVGGQCSAVR